MMVDDGSSGDDTAMSSSPLATNQTHVCGAPLVRINGRSLKEALRQTGARNRFGQFPGTSWVDICPACDAYALGLETTHPWPFLCADGVMRTAEDLDGDDRVFHGDILDFCDFLFSRSAFESAVAIVQLENPGIPDIEHFGAMVRSRQTPEMSLEFCRQVCAWGRGQRVWGNLLRIHGEQNLSTMLCQWFNDVTTGLDAESAIAQGIKLNGLGVSFASKHLRMLDPDQYAVLDDVISRGLGFALNPKGFRLFISSLRRFRSLYRMPHQLSTIESAIFILVRQRVRSQHSAIPWLAT